MPLTLTVFSLGITGLLVLLIALVMNWSAISDSFGLDKLLALACPLEAAALAAFAAEHLFGSAIVAPAVPRYMPFPLFWTILVGCALLAAALSLAFHHSVQLSSALAGAMIFLFILMVHLPRIAAHLYDRISWNVILRDLSFASGLIALAAAAGKWPHSARVTPRAITALVAILFGLEHFLYPANLPGVPLEKLSPDWLRWPHLWAAITGLSLILCGAAMLLPRFTRPAAALQGLWQLALILAIYLPMLALAQPGGGKLEMLNYVWDTTLHAATFLLIGSSTQPATVRSLTLVQTQPAA